MAILKYLEFRDSKNFEWDSDLNNFITFIGEGNERILNSLMIKNKEVIVSIDSVKITNKNLEKMRKYITFVLNKHLDTFLGETVRDEIAFGLESIGMSKDDMNNIIETTAREFRLNDFLNKDPNSLGVSDRAKLKIVNALVCEPKILVLDNILDELDYDDKNRVIVLLKEYIEKENIILNFTSNIEDTIFGNRIIVSDKEKILMDGKTLSVLNEEKLMKRLGLGLPFIIELNRYLMDYEIILKYELDVKKLVDKIWK